MEMMVLLLMETWNPLLNLGGSIEDMEPMVIVDDSLVRGMMEP